MPIKKAIQWCLMQIWKWLDSISWHSTSTGNGCWSPWQQLFIQKWPIKFADMIKNCQKFTKMRSFGSLIDKNDPWNTYNKYTNQMVQYYQKFTKKSSFQKVEQNLFYDTSHNSHWKCPKQIPQSQFKNTHLKMATFFPNLSYNCYKIVKLAKNQTNYLPPYFAY